MFPQHFASWLFYAVYTDGVELYRDGLAAHTSTEDEENQVLLLTINNKIQRENDSGGIVFPPFLSSETFVHRIQATPNHNTYTNKADKLDTSQESNSGSEK